MRRSCLSIIVRTRMDVVMSTVPILLLLTAGLLRPSQQQEVDFVATPSPYYYLLPGQSCVIPCEGTVQEEESEGSITLSATFYRNDTLLTLSTLPCQHQLLVDTMENVIGLFLSAACEDSHTTYHCVVGGLTSVLSRIYVADGLPLGLVSPPVQIGETLNSIMIAWGYSPTPLHAPLLGYDITLRSCDEPHEIVAMIATTSNETELTLFELTPDTTLCVTVCGRNSFGRGEPSVVLEVNSVSALVPPAPSHVNASRDGGVVTVTWLPVTIEYDIMTPLQDYLISYGSAGSTHALTASINNLTTTFRLFSADSSRNFQVGVAARNSVGHSQFIYTEIMADDPLPSQLLNPAELLLLVATVSTVLLAFLLLGVVAVAIFCYQRHRKLPNPTKRDPSSSLALSSQHLSTDSHRWPPRNLQTANFFHTPHSYEDERYNSKMDVLTWQAGFSPDTV